MNITVKDVPKDLHKRLREAADLSGRSLNKLILHTLDHCFTPKEVDRGRLATRIRERREGLSVWLEDSGLRAAIEEGRR